jgi:integrase
MDISNVQKDPTFIEYLEDKLLKPRSEEVYTYHMYNYCKATNMLPTELLEEAEEEDAGGIRLRKTKVRIHLKAFEKYMEDKDFSKNHSQIAMSSIRNFYDHYDIELPHKKRNKIPKNHETFEDLPTKEEIGKALSFCNPKYKSIILTMVSSSMGSSEVRNLKVKDFVEAISEYVKNPLKLPFDIPQIRSEVNRSVFVGVWHIKRIKTSMPYVCFTSPEANNTILDYLERYPPNSINDYLFPKILKCREEMISESAFSKYFSALNKKLGLGKINKYAKLHSHSLRKYFASKLLEKDIQQVHTDALLGHAAKSQTTGAYFKVNETHLKNIYLSVVSDLTIIDEIEIQKLQSDEYKELQELKKAEKDRDSEIVELKKAELERKNEMEDLKNKYKRLEETLEGIKKPIFEENPMDLSTPKKMIEDYENNENK